MMSGDFVSESCPTYAVVDLNNKGKKPLNEEVQESSADFALYAVVDKKKKKRQLSDDDEDSCNNQNEVYSMVDNKSYSVVNKPYSMGEGFPESTYSVLNRDISHDITLRESPSCQKRDWKLPGAGLVITLTIVVIAMLLIIVALIILTAVSFVMISTLKSELTLAQTGLLSFCNGTTTICIPQNMTSNISIPSNKNSNNASTCNITSKGSIPPMNNCSIYSQATNLSNNYLYLINNSDSNFLELLQKCTENACLHHNVVIEKCFQLLIRQIYGQSELYPAPSCQVIHNINPISTSGYYWVISSNGSGIRVYCEMSKSCGAITGGLTRIAVLNDSTRPEICTGNFELADWNRRCVKTDPGQGCSEKVFPVMNIEYSHACGTVEGSYEGYPDGFIGNMRSASTIINDNYVDGISLTYGNTSYRNHVWTFIGDDDGGSRTCPSNVPLSIVGHNYSCLKYFGGGCPSTTDMCSPNFFIELQQPVREDLQLRLCQDGHRTHGADLDTIYIRNAEIYVW